MVYFLFFLYSMSFFDFYLNESDTAETPHYSLKQKLYFSKVRRPDHKRPLVFFIFFPLPRSHPPAGCERGKWGVHGAERGAVRGFDGQPLAAAGHRHLQDPLGRVIAPLCPMDYILPFILLKGKFILFKYAVYITTFVQVFLFNVIKIQNQFFFLFFSW